VSDHHAIGAVSEALRGLLRSRMPAITGVDGALQVTVGLPPADDDGDSDARVNLFLYRVAENEFLKNQEIPGHGSPGAYGTPPLSLNLHYLLTAYGRTEEEGGPDETLAHDVLGCAMSVLHDVPVITEELLTGGNGDTPILPQALRGSFERIKIVLNPLSLDELTKVWTALSRPYRASAAYEVDVVQIESRRPRIYPRPVGEPTAAGPRIHASPFRHPRIDSVRVLRGGRVSEYFYARVGDQVVLEGREFENEDPTRVTIGGVAVTTGLTVTARRITFTVPDHPELEAGPQGIRVALQRAYDEAGTDLRPIYESNVAPLVLVPRIDSVTFNAADEGSIRITGKLLFSRTRESVVLIGSTLRRPSAKDESNTPDSISVPRGDLAAGTYPVRGRVGGAEALEEGTVELT